MLEIREKIIRFVHTMYNAEGGEIAATCAITGIHMDRQIRKSCPFPASMRDKAEELSVIRLAA